MDLSNWQETYRDSIASAKEAVGRIQSGQRVFIGSGCGQPQALVDALLERSGELDDVEIIHLLTLGNPQYRHRELAERFRLSHFLMPEETTDPVHRSLAEYTPVFLSDIPALFRTGQLPIDFALIQVTAPNNQGLCSLGISVDITKSAVDNARFVIAQVNPQMPWTMGESLLYIHDIDILVPVEAPILEIQWPAPTDTSRRIAENMASLVPNGATLEVGTSCISRALLECLKDRHDLGIHTDVVCDAVLDVIESGAVTGTRKTFDQHKVVASMCMGTSRLYEHVNQNPMFCLRPADYVSDPYTIRQLDNIVAVSVGCEIDLTGQVSADSPESGFPGMNAHADFVHGVIGAPRGRLILAIESTSIDVAASRIVPFLSPGAGVSAGRSEVHYVVTEYGVAYLHGKTIQERAMALISIAHPDFRAELLRAAIEQKYVSSDMTAVEGRILVGPPEIRTSMVLDDGTQIGFRPMHPTDARHMRELLHSLSQQTIHYRFMTNVTRLPRKEIQNFIYTDYRSEMAIVGTVPEAHGEEIVAIGRYYLAPHTNRAEVAFTVHDNWQQRGIGTFLLNYIVTLARQNGIAGLTAEVLRDNKAMLSVFRKSGCRIQSVFEDGVFRLELDLA